MLIVSVALRASAAPRGSNALDPAAPPPIAVYTSLTCGFFSTIARACSAVASVCSKRAPRRQRQVDLRLRQVVWAE